MLGIFQNGTGATLTGSPMTLSTDDLRITRPTRRERVCRASVADGPIARTREVRFPRAEAHLGNVSYADFQVRGSDVLLSFRYAAHLTPGLPPGELAPSSRASLMKLQGTIEQWIGGNSRVEVAGHVHAPVRWFGERHVPVCVTATT